MSSWERHVEAREASADWAASLALAEQDFRDATERAEELRRLRNDMVVTSAAHGATYAQIAEAMGVSRARVGQIVLEARST